MKLGFCVGFEWKIVWFEFLIVLNIKVLWGGILVCRIEECYNV